MRAAENRRKVKTLCDSRRHARAPRAMADGNQSGARQARAGSAGRRPLTRRYACAEGPQHGLERRQGPAARAPQPARGLTDGDGRAFFFTPTRSRARAARSRARAVLAHNHPSPGVCVSSRVRRGERAALLRLRLRVRRGCFGRETVCRRPSRVHDRPHAAQRAAQSDSSRCSARAAPSLGAVGRRTTPQRRRDRRELLDAQLCGRVWPWSCLAEARATARCQHAWAHCTSMRATLRLI